jgi:cytochrome b6-f complex iron-sulfur subunit
VAVIRTADGFRAFSAVCTHLGCIVHWNQAERVFECPCHAAAFDAAGQVVSGPPPSPLPEYKVSVVQGEVIVTSAVNF